MRETDGSVMDLQDVMKQHANPDLSLLEEQQTIPAAPVERLVKGRDH
jgi:hypothetical protein